MARQRLLLLQELQEADLGHGGRGGPRGESIALVLAVMAEKCADKASRWIPGPASSVRSCSSCMSGPYRHASSTCCISLT